MFGHSGCGKGLSVSMTPTCLSQLIFGLCLVNINGKWLSVKAFPVCKVASVCYFLFFSNGMERSRKVRWSREGKKCRKLWQPGVFPLFIRNASPYKSMGMRGNIEPALKEQFLGFLKGCVLTKGHEWALMCLWVPALTFWGARCGILPCNHSVAMTWRGQGVLSCFGCWLHWPIFCLTEPSCLIGCDHAGAHTWLMNEWQARLPHRGPIDDIITWHLVTPPFMCSQSHSVAPWLFHRHDALLLVF